MALILSALLLVTAYAPTKPPIVGEKARPLDLWTLDKKMVRLGHLTKQGPVVLVMLRGYPGYQCPFCTRQVGELIAESSKFAGRKAAVVLVYPGPAAELDKFAGEFVEGKNLPSNFSFTLDPDYVFTNRYGLRWDAEKETAYPSTFVIGRDGRVAYARVSRSHGDRAPLTEVLAAIDKLPTKR